MINQRRFNKKFHALLQARVEHMRKFMCMDSRDELDNRRFVEDATPDFNDFNLHRSIAYVKKDFNFTINSSKQTT